MSRSTSEVAIEHNLVVTVTGLDGESSVSADEGEVSNVDLLLNFTPPQNETVNVNLSYTNINGTPAMMAMDQCLRIDHGAFQFL